MTEEQLQVFLADAKDNTELQDKLKAASNANTVAAITKEAGFNISAGDLKKAQSEISDDELERAVGGKRLNPAFCTLGASPAINSCLDGAMKMW
ncbi:Nif11-like leader peptide family natural product precursor [Synechococcus sp. UW179A]|uniref:Nif11-like leader peptide family natural product precursor n=1 Tax=Synechococcus sp. UW179A TaxID=2575510 RepID=UPI000E0EE249|nr:Nif11-like leader peptide family natural product precursor [Synechococcus sp. UW179A]